ncbi:CSG1/SUR1-like protein [Elasticomyces elasticus]|nr:CSG1/SUR1-like protein [Elasticomyces elasticus]
MEYIRLGNSGLKVSKVIIGCMTFGDPKWQPWLLDMEAGLPILKHAYDSGINTFDVADAYSNGRSEVILGEFLRRYEIPREKVVIMSKMFNFVDENGGPIDPAAMGDNSGPRVNQVGLGRKHVMAAIDKSVARLGTYIDVLQTHRLDREAPTKEIMKALNDVVESGKVRYLGASSMAAWEFQMLQSTAEKHGWHQFISMQGFYSLLYREEEREMIPYCRATGVGYMPWSPLAAGVLAHSWEDRSDKREATDPYLKMLFRDSDHGSERDIVEKVEELAKNKGVGMAQVALAWATGEDGMFAPIAGLDSKERVDQAVLAMKVKLTPEERESLEGPYVPKAAMPF